MAFVTALMNSLITILLSDTSGVQALCVCVGVCWICWYYPWINMHGHLWPVVWVCVKKADGSGRERWSSLPRRISHSAVQLCPSPHLWLFLPVCFPPPALSFYGCLITVQSFPYITCLGSGGGSVSVHANSISLSHWMYCLGILHFRVCVCVWLCICVCVCVWLF